MSSPAKLIISRIATWAYILCAVLAGAFTVSFLGFPGGPAAMGYAVVFLFLLVCALGAVVCIAAAGAWKERKKVVLICALAWPLPIYFSALFLRAMLA